MRKSVVILGAAIGALSAALAAQQPVSSPPAVVVEFDPAGVPYDNYYRPPCGGEVHQRARQRHEEREAARIAEGGNPRRRLFMYTCATVNSAAPDAGAAVPPAAGFDLAAQPVASRAPSAEPVMAQVDLNGNPISPAPVPDCTRARAAALRQHLALEEQRLAADPAALRTRFEFQCGAANPAQGSASAGSTNSFGFGEDRFAVANAASADAPNYSRSNSAAASSAMREDDGRVRVERASSQRCSETIFETTCSSRSVVTIGNSDSARDASRAALEATLDRLSEPD